MDTVKDFELKRRKYIPVFPKANGKPTVYINGYPYEDGEPMAASGAHGIQINTFYDQLWRYFEINTDIYVGVDSFIYYREGDGEKFVAPDVYVVFGVEKVPPRKSFYTWEEGAVPAAVFEFLSDSTANRDRYEKVRLYLIDMGVEEYFIHQPDPERLPEFRGWHRSSSGGIVEMVPDAQGGLFSEALNLQLQWTDSVRHVRLLRPYLPDGTPITTSTEEEHLRVEAQELAAEESQQRREESQRRREAETLAQSEAQRRREAETLAQSEAQRRREAETLAQSEAERRRTETERRQEAEAELQRLRAQLANRQDEGA